eukprot:CAMPEP_0114602838 /NCGR_PEP_ID=MMETSP0125-20121206/25378_1 /TAXON_ID=485358 ORGANISM="Aristerostoma sp., Strain ATCC 50986" /NCGR_SAMPLE_ID=MMETSP0125 /ASSEMBLY_ACC=CAM_ASM_000245 /LENGTH=67 /DNA_ID=CAMNT_0001813309 /DNA_START=148 /DNA_END=351 /DNA_ORIENTATION=+
MTSYQVFQDQSCYLVGTNTFNQAFCFVESNQYALLNPGMGFIIEQNFTCSNNTSPIEWAGYHDNLMS